YHVAVRIPRVLLVSRLEGKGRVDEIEIDVVELEFLETGLEGGFDAFRTMIVVPELRGDEHVVPLDLPRLEHLLHRFADLLFVSVALRSVELAKSRLQRRLGRGSGRHGIGDQCAEAEGGDGTGSIVEGHLRIAKGVALYHCFTPFMLTRWTSARGRRGPALDVDDQVFPGARAASQQVAFCRRLKRLGVILHRSGNQPALTGTARACALYSAVNPCRT